MGIVNAESLVALQTTFRALFQTFFAGVSPDWPQLAMEAPSVNAAESYQWLGSVPKMKKWVDEKTLEQLMGFNYTITNDDWEATLQVDRNHIEDDQLGMYRPRIAQLADEAARHPDELIFDLIKNGATSLGYDGQNFFDTDHAEGTSGTQSNKLTGTGTTVAQLTADFRAARAAMRKFKDDRGRPYLRGKPKLLWVIPPDIEGQVEEIANAATIGNTSNVLKGAFDYLVNGYATDVNDHVLVNASAPIKPFILQMRRRPEFVALDQPTQEAVFLRRKFLYGVEARYNGGYGLWQFAALTTNT
jgi:phage major head subunit gpT-like protein